FLGGLAVRRIAHAGRDEQIAIGAHWTQTDLDWELSAILALGEQVEARAHWPRVRISLIPGAMCPVPAAESLGQQHFDRLTEELLTRVAKEHLGLSIYDLDA